jgi:putative membrane protein
MRGLVVRWVVSAIALYLTSGIVPGVQVRGLGPLLAAAAVIGIVNAFVRPLVYLLTLPLTVVTFGFFALVVNAVMLLLASSFVPGFQVRGFWAAFWGWLVLSFFTFCVNVLIGEHGRLEVITVRY